MRVVVIGGGIAGLTAAWDIASRGDSSVQVEVLEAAGRVGGKLRSEQLCGVSIDVGAEAMLNRRPEGTALAAEAGLEVVYPAGAQSHLWVGGRVVPLPKSLMGVPLDLPALAASGVLSADAIRRIEREPSLPPMQIDGDLSVGDLISARFGDEVTDVLLEPLLGGVYAGHARQISAQCAAPGLVALAAQGSMLEAAKGSLATAQGAGAPVPVFAAVAGGMHRLPQKMADSGKFTVRTSVSVDSLARTDEGFTLHLTEDGHERVETADRVVLAVPAAVAAQLLAEVAPGAAGELTHFEAASVGVVSFAFDAAKALATSRVAEAGSGFLVPPTEKRGIKAATMSFAKWTQVREAGQGAGPDGQDVLFMRASVARLHEDEVLHETDEHIIDVARAELSAALGLNIEPLTAHVQRWWAGLPQYPVGHQTRVAHIRHEVAKVPGLAVAGAAYDGVGIPATIASARRAAHDVFATD